MRALTFHGPGRVRCERRPDPGILEPGDAVVRVELAAICGSDLHVYRGHETGLDPGTVLGHEFVGEVVEVGPEAAGLAVGDRVASPFTTSCGGCFFCAAGLTCRCPRGRLFGWVEGGEGLEGTQAELVRVPLAGSTLVGLPPGLGWEPALFAGDVAATGHYCAELAEAGPGRVAAVLGCGPVGLMAAAAAVERGATRVFAVDRVPERLELAAACGAEPLDLAAEPLAAVREATGGRGADCVLEAVGTAAATRLAVDLVRPGGVVAAVGFHTEAALAFSPGEAYDRNLTYRAGRCPARAYMERLLPWVAEHEALLAAVVSHRLPLAEGPRGYEIFDGKSEGCTKVVLRMG